MKKSLIALSVVSILGVGAFTIQASASDQNAAPINNTSKNINQRNYRCDNLTEAQKNLIEKGYNELTQEEKEIFDSYRQNKKRDLSDAELNKYYSITDKVHKYMDEDFKNQVKERREERKLHREEMNNNPNRENRQGKGKGRQSCN